MPLHLPLLAALLIALPGAPSLAEPSGECRLTGTVIDDGGEPLPGAAVTLLPGDHVARTDADGRYCFDDLPAGAYQLLVEFRGFAEIAAVDLAAEGSRTMQVRVPVRLREEVVVTATRTRKGLDDVAVRTQLIDSQLIQSVSARTLADAVEYTTGVRVESNCQNCNFSQIRMLGLEGPYTQILVDGQPLISSLAQVYGIEQIPARMIDRIEVVKGGGSALYGPGAVGGVVNVIPREPARSGGGIAVGSESMGGEPTWTGNGSFDWVDGPGTTRLTAYAQIDRIAPFDVDGDGFTEISQRDLDAVGARFNRYAFGRDGRLTIDVNRMSEYRRGGDQLELPPDQALVAEEISSLRNAASVSWLHMPGPRFDYMVTASLSSMDRDSYYGTFMDPNAFGTTSNELAVLDGQINTYPSPGHLLSFGLQHSRERLDDRQPAYDRRIDADYRNTGAFLQYDWAFAPGFQLLAGLRADRHSTVSRTILSPRLALMASPREDLDIRASLATGFRPPQAFDEDLHLSAAGGEPQLIFLSPDLREERSRNVMLGAEWKPRLGPGQALVELNLFHTRLTDLFHNVQADDPDTPWFEFMKINFGGARVEGIETNLGWGIGEELILQGGLVLQRARFDEAEPDFGSRDFFRTPEVYGNFSATWNNGVVDLFAGVRYTGPMKAPHFAGYISEDRLETTPAFTVVDLFLSKPLELSGRRIVFTLGLRNLTNAYQRDLDRGPLRDASYVYGPRFPRSVRVGFRFDL